MLYRRHQGLPLTETVKVVLPEPLGVEEVEYKSVLVAFEDDAPFSEETVATAVKLAAKRRRGDPRGLADRRCRPTSRSTPPLDGQEGEAQEKIEQAKLIGGMRVTGHVHRVRPNQAGHAIAEEARAIEGGAIVMGLRYRNGTPLTARRCRRCSPSVPAA